MNDKKWKKKPPREATEPQSSGSWRVVVLSLLAMAVAAGTWAVFEFVVWNSIPAELVGKWVVTRGPEEGALFDIYRNGALRVTVDQRERERILDARIVVKGKTIYTTTKNLTTGQEGTRVQTIKRLDGTRLVLETERGETIDLERAE